MHQHSLNTGDSYDAQAKYSSYAPPVKKTEQSRRGIRTRGRQDQLKREPGRELRLTEISVRESDMMSGSGKHFLQPLGNRDRPVTPPGTADPHIEITATLALE